MNFSPSFQLVVAATAGAVGAMMTDWLVNSSASGVMKLAGSLIDAGIAGGWAVAAAGTIFASLGPASTAYFRPLTRRSSFALGVGSAAVLSMLIPGGAA